MKKKLFLLLTLAFALSTSMFAQTEPTVLEEGGSGPYKAVMYEVEGFKEHTIFAPKDLSVFNAKNALPVLVWGNGGCANSPRGHEKFLNDTCWLLVSCQRQMRLVVWAVWVVATSRAQNSR